MDATQDVFSYDAVYQRADGRTPTTVRAAPENVEIETLGGDYPTSKRRAAFSIPARDIGIFAPEVGDKLAVSRGETLEFWRVSPDATGVCWRWKHDGLPNTRRVVYFEQDLEAEECRNKANVII